MQVAIVRAIETLSSIGHGAFSCASEEPLLCVLCGKILWTNEAPSVEQKRPYAKYLFLPATPTL